MEKPILVLGAPCNLGLAPTESGAPRSVHLAPTAYRELGLVARLGARDIGDVVAPPYTDFERPPGGVRNAAAITAYTSELAAAVGAGTRGDDFLLLLGGDCSIVLGVLLGLRARGRYGLVYVDGHNDFSVPITSWSGGVAGMDLAIAVGEGDSELLGLGGTRPLVRGEDVVVVGRKDLLDDPSPDTPSLRQSAITDLSYPAIQHRAPAAVSAEVLQRVARPELDGFWIHVDVDVLDPEEIPAVDSPEPGGLTVSALVELLRPLVRHPLARGLDVTIYDPALDPDRHCGARIVNLLQSVLAPAEPIDAAHGPTGNRAH